MTTANVPKDMKSGDSVTQMRSAIETAGFYIATSEAQAGAGARLPLHGYEQYYRDTRRPTLRRLQFQRHAAPSQEYVTRMVVDTGWLFRQPVAASNVGGNGFAMEVETPAYPKEALLALTGSLGSAFDVEELSARPAGVGEGEGPYLVRSADRCLTYFDELKSDYLYDETAKILPKAVAAKMICERLDIPLTRFANLVESGVVRKHKVYNLRFSKAMPELRVRCWGEPDVEALERALARDKAVQA